MSIYSIYTARFSRVAGLSQTAIPSSLGKHSDIVLRCATQNVLGVEPKFRLPKWSVYTAALGCLVSGCQG